MEELDLPEESLRMLESRIGMRITIIDNDGIFNCKQRRRVFSEERASHKKNAVCLCGFSEKCIAHCRYAMNRKCLESDSAFFSSCWKGICQIVVPLTFASVHYGMLYAGTFRSSERTPPEGLPEEFHLLYRSLPLPEEVEAEKLLPLLRIYADGIISYLRRENIVNDSYDLRSAVISDFLHRNLERSIGLPDLAEELGLSESHTSVLVKRLFGRPFSEYLAQRRIERACRYLSSTDLNLEETAKLCGFSSAFHLSKVFKRIKGIPPSRFRGRYRTGLLREDAE